MSLRRSAVTKSFLMFVLAAFVVALLPMSLFGQDQPVPKVELFGGYSWYNPGGNIDGMKVPSMPKGFGLASTFTFNRWAGLTADYGYHFKDDSLVQTFLFGPQLKARNSEHFQPFAELLFGWARNAPTGLDVHNSFALAGGGGIDLPISNWFTWRLIQADYIHNTYRDKTHLNMLTSERFDGARIQSGAVFTFGGAKPLPVSTSCSTASPAEVMAGEPVKVTMTPSNFNPKRTLTYTWESTGGKATSGNATTTIDTTGLNPGSYTVTGKVNDDRTGKKMSMANCTAGFTVKEPPKHPPVISCSASPNTVKSGDPATVTATASSPDNRPLTYSWNATAGRVTGSGTSVQLDTAGAPAGPITVNGTATDDRGLTASCSTSVNVEVPPPPPTASKLNEIGFPDKKKPARVDNAAKAILDDVALKLQRDADAKAVVIGFADAAEAKKTKNLAAMRAFNTKEYLTKEKGIDPTRIELRTDGEGTKAEIWIVPAGASFTGENTTVVDESTLVKKPVAKKKAPAKQ